MQEVIDRDDQIVCFVCRTVWTEMARLSVLYAGPYGLRWPDCLFCAQEVIDRDDLIVCFVCRTVWTEMA